MNRRRFLSALAAAPLLPFVARETEAAPPQSAPRTLPNMNTQRHFATLTSTGPGWTEVQVIDLGAPATVRFVRPNTRGDVLLTEGLHVSTQHRGAWRVNKDFAALQSQILQDYLEGRPAQ